MTVELLVNIDVDDLEKATAFYGDAFGLTVGRRFGTFAVEMVGAFSPIYLLVKEAGTPASPRTAQTRDYRRHWTPVHLDIVVSGIVAAVARRSEPARRAKAISRPTNGATSRPCPIPSDTASA